MGYTHPRSWIATAFSASAVALFAIVLHGPLNTNGPELLGQIARDNCRYDAADGSNIGNMHAASREDCRKIFDSFGRTRPGSKLYYEGAFLCEYANGACVAAPQPAASEIIIDNGQSGFSLSNGVTWYDLSFLQTYNDSLKYAFVMEHQREQMYASWKFTDVAPGTYNVRIALAPQLAAYATDYSYVVYDGKDELGRYPLPSSQELWKDIAEAEVTSGTLEVRLTAKSGGASYNFLLADAAQIVPVQATVAACGNGTADEGEQCDDRNTTDGDGCSNSCQVEEGWDCNDEHCVPYSCEDADGGKDFMTKGTKIEVMASGRFVTNDECMVRRFPDTTDTSYSGTPSCEGDNCYIHEQECSREYDPDLVDRCEFGCSDGACLPEPAADLSLQWSLSPEQEEGLGRTALPNDTLEMVIRLKNEGPDDAEVALLAFELPADWEFSGPSEECVVERFEHEVQVVCSLNIDAGEEGDYNVEFVLPEHRTPEGQRDEFEMNFSHHGNDPNQKNNHYRINLLPAYFLDGEGHRSSRQEIPAVCGNSIVEAGEQCDFGDRNSWGHCSPRTCQWVPDPPFGSSSSSRINDESICGNHILEAWEQCDDGNRTPGDGCSAECRLETSSARSSSTRSTPSACTGNECADGGNAYCSAQVMVCTPTSTSPCILCARPSR